MAHPNSPEAKYREKALADPRAQKIARLNDLYRQAWGMYPNARVCMTMGVQELPDATRSRVCEAVQKFNAWTVDNDPHGEHDFGQVVVDGHRCFFKFDYYDRSMEWGAEDPTNAAQTVRVLTIMLADEY